MILLDPADRRLEAEGGTNSTLHPLHLPGRAIGRMVKLFSGDGAGGASSHGLLLESFRLDISISMVKFLLVSHF